MALEWGQQKIPNGLIDYWEKIYQNWSQRICWSEFWTDFFSLNLCKVLKLPEKFDLSLISEIPCSY